MKKSKITLFTIILIILSGTFILTISDSRYMHETYAEVTGTSGSMKLDITLDTNETYIENNISYFRVKVSNTKDGKTSDTDIDYVLNINNIDNSNGIYYLIDDDGITSTNDGTYLESITTKTYSFNKNSDTKEFKVFVKSNDGKESTIKFNVNVEAIQKQME